MGRAARRTNSASWASISGREGNSEVPSMNSGWIARRLVRGDERVVDAEAPQGVADLDAARTAAHDDQRVVAGRERPSVYLAHRFALRSRRVCSWSMRNMTFGWRMRNSCKAGPATG